MLGLGPAGVPHAKTVLLLGVCHLHRALLDDVFCPENALKTPSKVYQSMQSCRTPTGPCPLEVTERAI